MVVPILSLQEKNIFTGMKIVVTSGVINIVHVQDPLRFGEATGNFAARCIKNEIAAKGSANIILETGTSQFETLNQLVAHTEIEWSKVTMFHLDEYIGLPITSKASF